MSDGEGGGDIERANVDADKVGTAAIREADAARSGWATGLFALASLLPLVMFMVMVFNLEALALLQWQHVPLILGALTWSLVMMRFADRFSTPLVILERIDGAGKAEKVDAEGGLKAIDWFLKGVDHALKRTGKG